MNSRIVFVLLLQIAAFPLFSQNNQASIKHENDGTSVVLDVTQGYRRDTIKQKIRRGYYYSDVKRKFKDLDIYQTRIAATASFADWFTKVQAGYGDVLRGKLHRKIVIPMHAKVSRGHTLNAEIQVGRTFALNQNVELTPFGGYSWEMEKLHARRRHTFYRARSGIYDFHWNAPLVGLSGSCTLSNVALYGSYKFLFALQEREYINFRHRRKSHYTSKRPKGFGNVGMIGAGYNFLNNWVVKAEYELASLHTKGGSVKSHSYKIGHHKHTHKLSSEVRLCLEYAF
jgi:hypothetical protein